MFTGFLRSAGRPLMKLYRNIFYRYSCLYRSIRGVDSLNIGGGPNFIGLGWINLEEVKSSFNPNPFRITADSSFPLKDACVKTIYSSHCLEHLDTKTVHKVFSEAFRVLKKDGQFIIKLPDFDCALDAWRRGDLNFFDDKFWGFPSVTDTWKNRRIEDCIDRRASMVFCSFWNSSYGDHYAEKISKNDAAYHGPAVTDIDFLQKLKNDNTPSQISEALSCFVEKNEKDYRFNHRNAWSRGELQDLLASSGFQVVTFDKNTILSDFSHIPGIRAQESQSMYCWVKKSSS